MSLRLATAFLILAIPAARADDLPKAEEILDKYIEVTGGKSAYEKLKNRVTTGTLEIAGAGIKGKLTLYQARPAQMLTKVDFEQIGTTTQGVTDGIAWEQNPLTGDRVLSGEEKAAAIRNARFDSDTAWREIYEKAETVGTEEVDGKAAYKVELTPKEGNPTTNFYDKESGLVVRSDSKLKTPMGNIPVSTLLSDYKKVDGILVPHKTRQKVLTQEITVTLDEIKHDVDIPEGTFAVPAEIKKLADKK